MARQTSTSLTDPSSFNSFHPQMNNQQALEVAAAAALYHSNQSQPNASGSASGSGTQPPSSPAKRSARGRAKRPFDQVHEEDFQVDDLNVNLFGNQLDLPTQVETGTGKKPSGGRKSKKTMAEEREAEKVAKSSTTTGHQDLYAIDHQLLDHHSPYNPHQEVLVDLPTLPHALPSKAKKQKTLTSSSKEGGGSGAGKKRELVPKPLTTNTTSDDMVDPNLEGGPMLIHEDGGIGGMLPSTPQEGKRRRGRPLGTKNKPGHQAGRPKKDAPPRPPKVKISKGPVGRPRKVGVPKNPPIPPNIAPAPQQHQHQQTPSLPNLPPLQPSPLPLPDYNDSTLGSGIGGGSASGNGNGGGGGNGTGGEQRYELPPPLGVGQNYGTGMGHQENDFGAYDLNEGDIVIDPELS